MANAISNISFVCGNAHVPTKEMWNKKFYVYDKGQLVQGKFKKVKFLEFSDTCYTTHTMVALANGTIMCAYPSTKLYASPKDFVEENPISNVWREIFPHDIQSAFCKLFPQINRVGKVWRFHKNVGKYLLTPFKVVEVELNEDLNIVNDNEFYNEVKKANGNFYATLDECMSNEGIEVVEFEEEEKDNYKVIEEYIYRKFLFFMDSIDAGEISERLAYRVLQDLTETADKDFNTGDIDIAITRALKEILGVE